jgi:hypothetical protein
MEDFQKKGSRPVCMFFFSFGQYCSSWSDPVSYPDSSSDSEFTNPIESVSSPGPDPQPQHFYQWYNYSYQYWYHFCC